MFVNVSNNIAQTKYTQDDGDAADDGGAALETIDVFYKQSDVNRKENVNINKSKKALYFCL